MSRFVYPVDTDQFQRIREDGKVYVDGQLLDEPYINELTHTDFGYHNYPVTVPADCVFVMGVTNLHFLVGVGMFLTNNVV